MINTLLICANSLLGFHFIVKAFENLGGKKCLAALYGFTATLAFLNVILLRTGVF